MIKKWNKLLLILLFVSQLLLAGCWDFQDVNRRSITLGVGVDKIDGKIQYSGENAKLVPSPKAPEKSQVSDVYYFTSVMGKDFEEARNNYIDKIPLPDFLGAVRVVVFSQAFAAENGIESYANRVNRLFGYRKSLLLAVSRESPKDLFQKNVVNNISVGFATENTIDHLRNEGSAIYPRVSDVLSDIALTQVGYVLPYIGKENDTIVLLGYAVMKDSKLIDIMNVKDADGLIYMLLDNAQTIKAFPHPANKNNNISVRTYLKKRSIKTSYVNNKINIDIKLKMDAQIQYIYFVQPITDDGLKAIEDMITYNVKSSIISVINKSQEEYQTDIFGFARYFRADNLKIYKQIKWKHEYPYANINVDVKIRLVNLNLLDPNAETKY